MKLKYLPEDFRVEELPTVSPDQTGRYQFYRLVKRNVGTMEAVASIRRRWNLAGSQVSYAGLKDRHALTTQYLSIANGPVKSLREKDFQLEPVGRLGHPYGPGHFRGNRFRLVLRDLSKAGMSRARAEIERLPKAELPNYFDDQRFGSVRPGGEFIAHAWLITAFERALWLALAQPSESDRSAQKAQKALLRACWGRWPEAKARLARSSTRSIVTYLVDHPTDFRGAFARMGRDLRALFFSAFQSHLWNLILAGLLDRLTVPDQRGSVALKMGTFPFPKWLDRDQVQTLSQTPIPLPSARTPAPDGLLGEVVHEALEPFQLEWSDLRIRHQKDIFFSKGTRTCLLRPERLEFSSLDDEFHPQRQALRLSFELPRGSYATILVKRITQCASASS
jgi:tRNA pseudouridine13 synthase